MIKGLGAVYMVEDSDFWLRLSLKSVLPFVDKVVIVAGFGKDIYKNNKMLESISAFNDERIEVHSIRYKHESKSADGEQRNEYLNILKEKYKDWWFLACDEDEILSDNGYELRAIAEKAEALNCECLDIHMEHFIGNFGCVDAMVPQHFVLRRFFKVHDGLQYPFNEHPILDGVRGQTYETNDVTLFHCSNMDNMVSVIRKYHNNLKKSTMHTPEFLSQWKNWHLKGTYKVKEYVGEYPKALKEEFLL